MGGEKSKWEMNEVQILGGSEEEQTGVGIRRWEEDLKVVKLLRGGDKRRVEEEGRVEIRKRRWVEE